MTIIAGLFAAWPRIGVIKKGVLKALGDSDIRAAAAAIVAIIRATGVDLSGFSKEVDEQHAALMKEAKAAGPVPSGNPDAFNAGSNNASGP